MKFHSFEELVGLLAQKREEKKPQAKSIEGSRPQLNYISSIEEKTAHREALKRAKAEYKRSCMAESQEIEKEDSSSKTKETTDTIQENIKTNKRKISESEILSELKNLVENTDSLQEFNRVCDKFRNILEGEDILDFFDKSRKKTLEDFKIHQSVRVKRKKYKTIPTSSLTPSMSEEERRRRNGDKSKINGFSSTGVKLPTKRELEEYHEKLQGQRERHDKFLKENPERKRHGKMVIYIASGGMNKRY